MCPSYPTPGAGMTYSAVQSQLDAVLRADVTLRCCERVKAASTPRALLKSEHKGQRVKKRAGWLKECLQQGACACQWHAVCMLPLQ